MKFSFWFALAVIVAYTTVVADDAPATNIVNGDEPLSTHAR